jgi:hypothetical protein
VILIGPKRETVRVRLAIKKVHVVLPHKKAGLVDRIVRRLT